MTSPLQRTRDELRMLKANYGDRDVVMGSAMHISDLRLLLELAEADVDAEAALNGVNRLPMTSAMWRDAWQRRADALRRRSDARRKLTQEADDA